MISEAKVISVVVALGAFIVAMVAGLAADNPAWVVLTRALVAMLAGQFIGLGAGEVLAYVRRAHTADYVKRHPIPDVRLTGEASATPDGGQTVENSS